MISKLTPEDKKLLKKRYGDDLEHPLKTTLTKEERNKYYNVLVYKMRKMLANPDYEYEPLNNNKVGNVEDILTKEDYIKLKEILEMSVFKEMSETLSLEITLAIILKLGYVNGKCFNSESIAQIIKVDESKVREIIKQYLMDYKEYLNNYMSSNIDVNNNLKRPI